MYDPTLSQVIFDCNEYQKLINYIEKARTDLPNWRGKPKYNVIFECVDKWEKEVLKIKKTMLPAMKDLIVQIESNEHLNIVNGINKELNRE